MKKSREKKGLGNKYGNYGGENSPIMKALRKGTAVTESLVSFSFQNSFLPTSSEFNQLTDEPVVSSMTLLPIPSFERFETCLSLHKTIPKFPLFDIIPGCLVCLTKFGFFVST